MPIESEIPAMTIISYHVGNCSASKYTVYLNFYVLVNTELHRRRNQGAGGLQPPKHILSDMKCNNLLTSQECMINSYKFIRRTDEQNLNEIGKQFVSVNSRYFPNTCTNQ